MNNSNMPTQPPEPWLRETHLDIAPVQRAIVHALELTREDILYWCRLLTPGELEAKWLGLPSVAFQIRHIVNSLDRLLSYAEGRSLSASQLEALQGEHLPSSTQLSFQDFEAKLAVAIKRVLSFESAQLEQPSIVGRSRISTTIAGLLVHCAEHTQRHTGQAITTAKVAIALRATDRSNDPSA